MLPRVAKSLSPFEKSPALGSFCQSWDGTLGKLWMEVGSPHEKGAPNNQVIGSLLEIADVGFVLPNSPR